MAGNNLNGGTLYAATVGSSYSATVGGVVAQYTVQSLAAYLVANPGATIVYRLMSVAPAVVDNTAYASQALLLAAYGGSYVQSPGSGSAASPLDCRWAAYCSDLSTHNTTVPSPGIPVGFMI